MAESLSGFLKLPPADAGKRRIVDIDTGGLVLKAACALMVMATKGLQTLCLPSSTMRREGGRGEIGRWICGLIVRRQRPRRQWRISLLLEWGGRLQRRGRGQCGNAFPGDGSGGGRADGRRRRLAPGVIAARNPLTSTTRQLRRLGRTASSLRMTTMRRPRRGLRRV